MSSAIRKGWLAVAFVFVFGFSIMAYSGKQVYRQAPPIPTFRAADGTMLCSAEDVLTGQQIWQSIGGQQVGSIWGHGALQAPDWTADWLHREAARTIELLGAESANYVSQVRHNTYDALSNEVTLFPERVQAVTQLTSFYSALFTGIAVAADGTDLRRLRQLFAIKDTMLWDEDKARLMCCFIFWSAWAAVTNRPGANISYTNNWPSERLVENYVTVDIVFWSLISVALLVVGIGALAWWKARSEPPLAYEAPIDDPCSEITITPSMMSMQKWAWVVALLQGFQICLGVYLAHISVEGDLGIPKWITQNLTYVVARTWHTQSAVFAIATSFLGAGLFLAPAIAGRKKDPPLQLLGCNFLFGCLLLIVAGSYAGQMAAVQQIFKSLLMSQWFGHQGYEYVDLGRFWQYFLFVGLLVWLVLMVNAIWPALTAKISTPAERGHWHFVVMIVIASVLMASFYSAGFMYSAKSNLAVMDYWRFWIVHMWVEGIFEVFVTVIVAYIFVKLGVLESEGAAAVSLVTTCVFLFGGIPGMYHHNYFSGTPTMIVAIGACFSALEVVPLALMGFEAAEYVSIQTAAEKVQNEWLLKYKPIIDCFVYVAFWNMVGAGFLGFLINPPVSLYYMQGGYLTNAHSHGALWGVYGVLALALSLLVLRLSDTKAVWDVTLLNMGLRLLNIGMLFQIFLSIFPIGLYQAWTAIKYDYWYARSDLFHGDSTVKFLKCCRALGDTIFAVGMLSVLFFISQLALKRFLSRSTQKSALGAHLLSGIRQTRVEPPILGN